MQKFNKTKIALAVGASLVAAAGAVQAAVPAAPTLRATPATIKPAVITTVTTAGATGARKLYDGTGYNGALQVTLQFKAPAATISTPDNAAGQAAQLNAGTDGFLVNGAGYALASTTAGTVPVTTTDDVSVYVGATAATGLALGVTNLGFNANVGGATIGTGPVTEFATAVISVSSGDTASGVTPAFRMSTGGTLQWIADIATGATAANWLDVRFDVNDPGTAAGTAGATVAFKGINAADLTINSGGGSSGANGTSPTVTANTGALTTVSSASSTKVTAAAAQLIWNGVAPTVIVATRAPSTASTGHVVGLVDGVTIDTLTPLTGFTVANVAVSAVALGTTGGVTGSHNIALDAIAAAASSANVNGTGATATNATGTAKYTVSFTTPSTTANWSSDSSVTAGKNYTSADFNTGISSAGGSVPFDVKILDSAAALYYTSVFNTVGLPVSASVGGVAGTLATVVDGASPVVTGAVWDSAPANDTLALTFSEPMENTTNATGGSLREVAENVLIGGNALSALNLNLGGILSIDVAGNLPAGSSAGTSVLTITGVPTGSVASGSVITVKPGLAFKEPNDVSYSTQINQLDTDFSAASLVNGIWLSGGIQNANSNVVETATTAPGLTASLTTPSITFGNGTTTSATGDGTVTAVVTTYASGKVHQLGVNFPSTKYPVQAIAPSPNGVLTTTSLDNQIVVTIDGTAIGGGAPAKFQFFPTGAALSLNSAGTQLTINLPTDLIYQKLGSVIGATVEYLQAGETAKTLTNKTAITSPAVAAGALVAASGAEAVVMPQAAISNTLLTQNIQATLMNGSSAMVAGGDWDGAVVEAYVAKFNDVATVLSPTVTISKGKISSPGDKVATDLALEYTSGQQVALQNAVALALYGVAPKKLAVNGVSAEVAEVKATPLTVYVQFVRSNDVQPGSNPATQGTAAGVQTGGNAPAIDVTDTNGYQAAVNSLQSRARLSTVSTDSDFDTVDPIYAVTLDPVTGKIDGRLQGSVAIKSTPAYSADRGLLFVNTSTGALQTSTTGALAGAATVGATGGLDLLIGVDVKSVANRDKLRDAFVLLKATKADGTYAQLTSADPDAANYLPFDANLLSGSGDRTILQNVAEIKGTSSSPTYTAPKFDVNRLKKVTLANSTAWQLLALGNPEKNANPKYVAKGGQNLPRFFVGMNGSSIKSLWTDNTYRENQAMMLQGPVAAMATELSDGVTLSQIDPTSNLFTVASAMAMVEDGIKSAGDNITVQQAPATPVVPAKLSKGWNLITKPAAFTANTVTATAADDMAGKKISIYKTVDAIIRVGAQADTQMTWIKGDAAPSLNSGEALFVYSPNGGDF